MSGYEPAKLLALREALGAASAMLRNDPHSGWLAFFNDAFTECDALCSAEGPEPQRVSELSRRILRAYSGSGSLADYAPVVSTSEPPGFRLRPGMEDWDEVSDDVHKLAVALAG